MAVGGMDRVGRDREIVEEELRGIRVVRMDAPDLGGRDDGDIGGFRGIKRLDRRLRRQIELLARPQQQRRVWFALEPPHQRGTDHALVSSDEEFHGK